MHPHINVGISHSTYQLHSNSASCKLTLFNDYSVVFTVAYVYPKLGAQIGDFVPPIRVTLKNFPAR